MRPPILQSWCPGGGGHWWARLNPRWFTDTKAYQREQHWCPDSAHQEEKKAHVSQGISRDREVRAMEYAALPLPTTKRCMNPDPKHHAPGAVLPAGRFYRRKGAFSDLLDSRCKECRREEARVRRENTDEETRKAKRKIYTQRHREKRKKARAALARERARRVPAAPFTDWLGTDVAHVGTGEMAIVTKVAETTIYRLRHRVDDTVKLTLVDQVGVALGDPNLVNRLYPPGE